jgi:predicted membrane-bound spermidine synthase
MNRIDSRNSLQWLVGSLLLLSGLCALVYQVGWLRELRLVFGGSTLATAVVLAIFMGGLGFGGLFWGRVADRHANPLRLYAFFEIGIALLAAISPFLLILVRNIYLGLGGSLSLGAPLALLVRLAAAALVLGGPTFLMGGTLPAVARALETDADHGRRRLALLYGLNTLGGVIGVILATFFLLELMGTRLTVWSGSLLNLLVGLLALALASQYKKNQVREAPRPVEAKPLPAGAIHEDLGHSAGTLPSYYVYITAFLVGFAFFVMEIVWNRMLTPLLGGSVYSFGLIIAVVLSGIGLGGWLYSLGDKRLSATTGTLALTVGLEALALAVPFALGDRFAVLAAILRPFGDLGFGGLLLGWTVVTAFVVFPASLVAGFQFPLLVNLLGRGRRDVGSHTGKVYAWNTFGAITGLLAGGMGLMRLLSAPGCWQATVVLLSLLGGSAAIVALFQQGRRALPVSALLGVGVALFLITAAGPTAAWRHTPIGAGNVSLAGKNRIGIRDWLNQSRRIISQDIEGIESSIGFQVYDGLGFVINGKVDGNAARDADTQIMGPFIGAILHPEPRKALVIGLGTGASGGWLADIASVEQVDIMELEPAMLEVARLSSQANRNVLENSKVRMIIGDARESLMTSRQQYDIIFSEPSNPYRAGIASL